MCAVYERYKPSVHECSVWKIQTFCKQSVPCAFSFVWEGLYQRSCEDENRYRLRRRQGRPGNFRSCAQWHIWRYAYGPFPEIQEIDWVYVVPRQLKEERYGTYGTYVQSCDYTSFFIICFSSPRALQGCLSCLETFGRARVEFSLWWVTARSRSSRRCRGGTYADAQYVQFKPMQYSSNRCSTYAYTPVPRVQHTGVWIGWKLSMRRRWDTPCGESWPVRTFQDLAVVQESSPQERCSTMQIFSSNLRAYVPSLRTVHGRWAVFMLKFASVRPLPAYSTRALICFYSQFKSLLNEDGVLAYD